MKRHLVEHLHVANKLSAIREWLLCVNNKTDVVETDATGFSAAFEESTLFY